MGAAEMNSPNPFEAIADQQLTAASKAKHRAAEKRMAKLVVQSERDAPMVASPADRAMFEASAQFREYKKWLKQREIELLSGQYASRLADLIATLKAISPETAPALVDWVEHADWLQGADYNTRHNVLAIIGDAIADYRIKQGLAPFDDSLWDEEPTAFEQIRFMLTGVASWAA